MKKEDTRHKIALIGFPWDNHSSFMRGSSLAPVIIREAFECKSTNKWSESGEDLGKQDLILDVGDIDLSSNKDGFNKIKETIRRVLKYDIPIISLGGDHSITYPIIKGFHEKYKSLQILHFDAHPDLYDELNGDRYSHGSPFARIMEERLVDRLVQVGIRTMNGHQRDQADRFRVEVYEMRDLKGYRKLKFNKPLYISFDIDVLDPAFAPGVSHFEPAGMTTREAVDMIQGVVAPEIVGADIVEYNPKRDINKVTAMVCAKILKEIISKMLEIKSNKNRRF